MNYVTVECIEQALARLHATAGHLLKIWLVLKHMGLAIGAPPVLIDTRNSTPSLERLFGFGDPEHRFFVPFAHTSRFTVMQGDASRSIVQTTIERWATSGSVVTCNPRGYLDFATTPDDKKEVSCGRAYPLGLGYSEDGFALEDGQRVAVPLASFAVWHGRETAIPDGADAREYLIEQLRADLHLSGAELDLVFVPDDLAVSVGPRAVTSQQLGRLCAPYIAGRRPPTVQLDLHEEYPQYVTRVRTMSSQLELPSWLRATPEDDFRALLGSGARAILLYGPPRTGKTRSIDSVVARTAPERATIQIHDGWTYDHLVQGFLPDADGHWDWKPGVLKNALSDGQKTFVVLEEINRTSFTQSLGEVFSLIEQGYRGPENAVMLRSGEPFWIPENVTIVMTMNTVDKSTEEIDDALLGRIASVDFPPSTPALTALLEGNGVPAEERTKLAQVHASILEFYPLGHGYFADLRGAVSKEEILSYYKTRIRPVLAISLGEFRANELEPVDNLVDELFGH